MHHFGRTDKYLPCVCFVDDAKTILSAVVEIFCVLIYCETREKPPV